MDKEQEKQFKEHIKKMAREEIQKTFTDNLMETLNSAFIFKYVETLELKCKKQKDVIDKLNFIKNRKNQGASQENINKMAIEFVNSYLKEVSE